MKTKYDLQVLRKLYEEYASQNQPATKFIAEAVSKYGLTKGYASALHSRFKKGYAPKVKSTVQIPEDQPTASPMQAEVIETKVSKAPSSVPITANDVNVKLDNILPEGKDLRQSYKKMFEEYGNESTSASSAINTNASETEDEPLEEDEPSDSTPEPSFRTPPSSDAVDFSNISSEQEKAFRIQLGSLLYQLGVAVNDNMIWQERKLTSDEKKQIGLFSKDLETKYGADLNSEDAPYINYFVAAFGLPMLSRLDLLPQKLNGFTKWLSENLNMKPPPQKTPPNPEQKQYDSQKVETAPGIVENVPATPPVVINPENAKYPTAYDTFSDNHKAWISNAITGGYYIDPNYTQAQALDVTAYREKKVVRNTYSKFGETF